MKWYRIKAFMLRHTYPLRRDFDLLSDMVYWPLIDIILWGVTSQWLVESSGIASLVSSILIALVLWNVIWRAQAEVSRNLMDEIWNHNLVNLFSTPLQLSEWITGVLLLSAFKTTMTMLIIIPSVYFLYSVNVLAIGGWLPIFFLSAAITGWWIGFVSAGVVLRHGPKAQTVIWTLPGILLPFSAIYFPLDKLPGVLQPISRMIPTTYIFEAMRSILAGAPVNSGTMIISFALNIVYLILAAWFFVRSYYFSKDMGLGRFD